MLLQSVTGVVKPSYRQFYLRRGEEEWASDQVSDEGYKTRLEAIGGFVYVGTSMWGFAVEVTFEVHDSEPLGIRDDADHIVEVSVSGSGPVAVLSWYWEPFDEPVAVVQVPVGDLRLRGTWTGVGAAETHPDQDLAGPELSPERLLFQAWPAQRGDRAVLKEWHSAGS